MELLNIPLTTVSFFFTIALIAVSVVEADDCRALHGYTAPTTREDLNATCYATDDMFRTIGAVINWKDGTSSTYTAYFFVQLVIGSCCSNFQASYFGTGVVTSGRFRGEGMRFIVTSRTPDVENSADDGLTRFISDTLLLIGTKGVRNWIECTGTTTTVVSPALTLNQQNVYSTFNVDYDKCSNCVESC